MSDMDTSPPPAYYQLVQADSVIPDAETIDVRRLFPETAISGDIKVTVSPPSGAVLIFSQANVDQPVRFGGPESTGTIVLSGPVIYIRKIAGATDYIIEVLGHKDGPKSP
jgi:hypothetical protein